MTYTLRSLSLLVRARPLTFFFVFILFLVTAFLKLDTDFGWHFMAGKYILHSGIPRADIFTYTARDFPWIDHEWLNDVIVYILQSVSPVVLASVSAIVCTFAVWLVAGSAKRFTILIGAAAIAPYVGVRASIWTVLGIAIVVHLINTRRRFWYYIVPLLFLFWANLHGGFVLGFALLGYSAIVRRSWRLLVFLLLGAAASLINPYGITLYIEIARTLFDTSLHSKISEWASFDVVYVMWPYLALWLTGFCLFSIKNWRHYKALDLLLLIAALSSARNWPLFVIVSLPQTDSYMRTFMSMLPPTLANIRQRFVLCILCAVVVMGSILATLVAYSQIDSERLSYPKDAVTYLREQPCNGHIFNYYDFGGYLIWQLPGQPVYIDGRMPSWQKNGVNYLDNYIRITKDKEFRQQQFTHYNIRCVVMPSTQSLVLALRSEGWKDRIKSDRYVLLEK